MLKKVLFTSIAIAISLNANSIKEEYLHCAEDFEKCMLNCTGQNSGSLCIEKCEMLFDKCMLAQESATENLDYQFEERSNKKEN